jgi:uncharacterized protein YoxC
MVIVIGVVNILVMVAMVALIFAVKAQVQTLSGRVEPIVSRAESIVTAAQPIVRSAGEVVEQAKVLMTDTKDQVHEIAETSKRTVKDLSHRMQTTGAIVQETVTDPTIQVAGALAGIGKGLSALRHGPRKNGGSGASNGDGAGV